MDDPLPVVDRLEPTGNDVAALDYGDRLDAARDDAQADAVEEWAERREQMTWTW